VRKEGGKEGGDYLMQFNLGKLDTEDRQGLSAQTFGIPTPQYALWTTAYHAHMVH